MRYNAIFCLILLSSCANLGHIQKYSEASSESLNSFSNLAINFTGICQDRCRVKHISDFAIWEPCDCQDAKSADSVFNALNKTVSAYFLGLNKLSGDAGKPLQTAQLADTLGEKDFGSLNFNQEEVSAYTRLLGVATSTFFATRNQRILAKTIKDTDLALQTLLIAMHRNMEENLLEFLGDLDGDRDSFYFSDVSDEDYSSMDKRIMVQEYYIQKDLLKSKQAAIKGYMEGLEKIRKGHAELAENSGKLNGKTMQANLALIGSELEQLNTAFKKLRN